MLSVVICGRKLHFEKWLEILNGLNVFRLLPASK